MFIESSCWLKHYELAQAGRDHPSPAIEVTVSVLELTAIDQQLVIA